jgi:flagella basal body P-ring formation protein FlgA
MTQFRILLAVCLPLTVLAAPCFAASVPASDPVWVASRTLHRGDILRAGDAAPGTPPYLPADALPASSDPTGLEARRTIYAGRPLTERDVGAPYLVKVSAPVDVTWKSDGLELAMSGRALDNGSMGDDIRVLNTATSRTIHGKVVGEGKVEVEGTP